MSLDKGASLTCVFFRWRAGRDGVLFFIMRLVHIKAEA